jgi:hypothetical protein
MVIIHVLPIGYASILERSSVQSRHLVFLCDFFSHSSIPYKTVAATIETSRNLDHLGHH